MKETQTSTQVGNAASRFCKRTLETQCHSADQHTHIYVCQYARMHIYTYTYMFHAHLMHAFFLGTPVATFQAQRARFVGQRGAREADTAWKCCRLEENTRASYRNTTFWTSANAAEKHMAPDFAFSTKRTAFFRKCMIWHRTELCAQVMHRTEHSGSLQGFIGRIPPSSTATSSSEGLL